MLKLENLSWQDNNQKTVLDNLSFEFPEKGLVVITGDRTYQEILFNLLTYQKKPSSGYLWIGEKTINHLLTVILLFVIILSLVFFLLKIFF